MIDFNAQNQRYARGGAFNHISGPYGFRLRPSHKGVYLPPQLSPSDTGFRPVLSPRRARKEP